MTWPAWLEGQGRWRVTDAARILTALAVPVVWALYGGPAAAAMFLALGGTMALRLCRLGAAADLLCQVVFFLSAWWAADGSYERWGPLDLVAHASSGAVIAVLLDRFLPHRGRSPWWRAVAIARGVLGLGLLWEVGELAGHVWLTPAIHVGRQDTATDLLADVLGGAAAACALAAGRVRRGTSGR